ncbi:MAG TPA: GNAT family N-acetyltransferase [Phototrophicaceae bacterium]|nr:GNAT family N-acetyltransferase [Phototrophicaceae bacterium]
MSSIPFIVRLRLECDRLSWDAFVDGCDEAWLWHRYDLQDAIAARRRIDLSFAVCDDKQGAILAVVPLHLVQGRFVRVAPWNVLNSTGAPALKSDLGEKPRRQLMEFIRERLIQLARQYQAFAVDLTYSQLAPAFRGERCPRINPLLEWGCENSLSQTYVLDLRQSEAVLRAGYSKTTRNELNRIERESVEIREATPNDLDLYYQLHCETYQRTGVPPHPKAYFQHIFEVFIPQGLSRVVFLLRDGEVVAAHNAGRYKGAAFYWTGASRSEKTVGEGRILMHNQIRQAQADGLGWFETGEAFPHLRSGKLKGLNDFKRSFGGELYPIYKGQLPVDRRLAALAAGIRAWRTPF